MTCACREIAGPGIELSPICLGHLWIFKNLDQKEIDALRIEATRKKMAKGQTLFQQDSQAGEMLLIKGGRVKLSKILEDGNELTLDIRKAGDFVGENMFSDEGTYPVSAICLQDTLTCGFTRNQFEQLVIRVE